jgi:DNA uptake protein ComE-like DNA-binding protein
MVVAAPRLVFPERRTKIEELPVESTESYRDTVPEKKVTSVGPLKNEFRMARDKRPLLDLNMCDSVSLEALPGIGPVLSARIIRYRNLLGGYASVEQLKEVYGLPEETFNLISSRFYTDSGDVRKININSADYRELIRLPYFEKYEVSAILKYRELRGGLGSINELIDNNIISAVKSKRVSPYLEFGNVVPK